MITPDRVVVEGDGYAVPTRVAGERYGITPTIVFIREDGWKLGAPEQYENLAYMSWEGEWLAFHRQGEGQKHISQYERKETCDQSK